MTKQKIIFALLGVAVLILPSLIFSRIESANASQVDIVQPLSQSSGSGSLIFLTTSLSLVILVTAITLYLSRIKSL